jgi:hypothetical protein
LGLGYCSKQEKTHMMTWCALIFLCVHLSKTFLLTAQQHTFVLLVMHDGKLRR